MPWIKKVKKPHACFGPIFMREVGSLWQCPKCGEVWEVRRRPDSPYTKYLGAKE